MNEQQALGVIEEMISGAKREIRENGFFYLFWGYLVFFSALTDYVLLNLDQPLHSVVWAILMPAGGLFTILYKRLRKESPRVVTYVDDMRKYLLTAFVVSLLIVCLIMPSSNNHWRGFFPVLMVLYAFCLYTMGGIIRFRPVQIGSFFVWACGALAFFLTYDYQLLVLAAAVMGGFILPGHQLKRRHV